MIGVYDVTDICAETGRIAVIGTSFESIEAQLLSFDFAFDVLKLEYTVNYVMADNVHALRFSQMFGSESSDPYTDEKGNVRIDGKITKESYQKSRIKLARMLYR